MNFFARLMGFRDLKDKPFVRDTEMAQRAEVFLDNHAIDSVWLQGYLESVNALRGEGRWIKVAQIDYVRGVVVRVYLATHPGWNCNCVECKEKRGREGLNARY